MRFPLPCAILLTLASGVGVAVAGECPSPLVSLGTLSPTGLVEVLIAATFVLAVVSAYALREAGRLRRRLRDSEAKLQDLGIHDALTELPNRALFVEFAEKVLANAKRHGSLFSLVSMDLDSLQATRDAHGSVIADQLLQAVACRIGDTVRKGDLLARVAEDQFIILLDSVKGRAGLVPVMSRLVTTISAPYIIDGRELEVGCSAGITLFPQDSDHLGELMRQADQARRAARLSGGNRGMFYDELPRDMA